MPGPYAELFIKMSKQSFVSKGIALPVKWEDQSENKQFTNAFFEAERKVDPNKPINLFREPTLNWYHVNTSKDTGKKFERYIEGICSAISDAIGKWMKMATIGGAVINGPVGIVSPGIMVGPNIESFIFSQAPQATEQERKYSRAIAKAVGNAWQKWHLGLSGVLLYPSFAAFPGPMAPPTPNVPMPVMAFGSSGERDLSTGRLSEAMMDALAECSAAHAQELFDSIATGFSAVFQIFKTSTLISNVLGIGPVPTFAPPILPMGPVLGGNTLLKPGVFTNPELWSGGCANNTGLNIPSGVSVDQNIIQAKGMNYHQWYDMVRNKQPWDYKQLGKEYQAFGNFNYGATGGAVGIPLNILLRGAGWANRTANPDTTKQFGEWWAQQPYGDDPADADNIKAGYEYYKTR